MDLIFMTAMDIARTLKISKALAYRLISQGQIPSLRIGKSVRVRSEDLERYIQSNMSGQSLPALGSDRSIFSQSTINHPRPHPSGPGEVSKHEKGS